MTAKTGGRTGRPKALGPVARCAVPGCPDPEGGAVTSGGISPTRVRLPGSELRACKGCYVRVKHRVGKGMALPEAVGSAHAPRVPKPTRPPKPAPAPVVPCAAPGCPDRLGGPLDYRTAAPRPRRASLSQWGLEGQVCERCLLRFKRRLGYGLCPALALADAWEAAPETPSAVARERAEVEARKAEIRPRCLPRIGRRHALTPPPDWGALGGPEFTRRLVAAWDARREKAITGGGADDDED